MTTTYHLPNYPITTNIIMPAILRLASLNCTICAILNAMRI